LFARIGAEAVLGVEQKRIVSSHAAVQLWGELSCFPYWTPDVRFPTVVTISCYQFTIDDVKIMW